MNANEAVYTTTTGDAPVVEVEDLREEWCAVCARPTDHRAEHDDLVGAGQVEYFPTAPQVRFIAA